MARYKRRKTFTKPIEKVEIKYSAKVLSESLEFLEYSDIILALFNPKDLVTKSEVKNAIKAHLEREV